MSALSCHGRSLSSVTNNLINTNTSQKACLPFQFGNVRDSDNLNPLLRRAKVTTRQLGKICIMFVFCKSPGTGEGRSHPAALGSWLPRTSDSYRGLEATHPGKSWGSLCRPLTDRHMGKIPSVVFWGSESSLLPALPEKGFR